MKKVVHAACPHDCPDACGVLITVEEGRATRIQGDPSHPVTRGFLCAKVAKYLDRVYSPERVLYPMRRVAPKGTVQGQSGRDPQTADFERITWEQALEEITNRFNGITTEFGSEAILPYSYGGTLGVLNFASMDRRFFHRLGASQLARNICSAAGEAGLKSVIGVKLGTEPEQFRHSRYIIAWASNIHGNNVHLWPFIEEARRSGAKLIVIDPYRTRTAACADWYLPINPGTDAALALGMMNVIINERLHDADYVQQYTVGFEELRQKIQEYPPERVATWTGISAGDIVRLAREYATVRPAVIRVNYGVQRSEGGGMATRAIAMLPCITGSWKEVGGGLQLSTSGAYGLNREALERPDLMVQSLGRPARTVNMVELGTALNTLQDPPIKALFVYNSNPAAVCPNHNQVVRGLRRRDLFTVVHEQFFTDTTDYADIVLPATTFFEHKELQTAYGHYYLQVSHQAIEPPGECRSNVEVFRALAEHMGFEDDCFRESVDQMMDAALVSENPWLKNINRERLEREGHVRLSFEDQEANHGSELPSFFLPFAKGNFVTPSGNAELYSESLKAQGLDPVVEYKPPANRDIARNRNHSHWSCWRAKPTIFSTRLFRTCL
jgi:anaerobic selenocysteine-containing dehydrogenase